MLFLLNAERFLLLVLMTRDNFINNDGTWGDYLVCCNVWNNCKRCPKWFENCFPILRSFWLRLSILWTFFFVRVWPFWSVVSLEMIHISWFNMDIEVFRVNNWLVRSWTTISSRCLNRSNWLWFALIYNFIPFLRCHN